MLGLKRQPEKIRWSIWSKTDAVQHGVMPLDKVNDCLLLYCRAAKKVMLKTGADHVVYCMKMFGRNKKASALHFYMWAMNDDEFSKVMRKVGNAEIYAVHRR